MLRKQLGLIMDTGPFDVYFGVWHLEVDPLCYVYIHC